jgi:hypothetical protein
MIMNERMQSVCANRREFLRGSLRHALLAGLAVVSGALVKRRGATLPGQTCINQGICRGCGAFENCDLPQALSAKQVQRSKPDSPTDEKSQQISPLKSSSVGTFHPLEKQRAKA